MIVPIFKKQDQADELLAKLNPLADQLQALGIRVKLDTSEKYTPGYKFADYELKGVPVRLAMGGRDLENNTIEIARRDTMEKETVSLDGIVERIQSLLEEIQKNILQESTGLPHRQHRVGWTVTRSSKRKSRKAASCSATGTARPRPRRR